MRISSKIVNANMVHLSEYPAHCLFRIWTSDAFRYYAFTERSDELTEGRESRKFGSTKLLTKSMCTLTGHQFSKLDLAMKKSFIWPIAVHRSKQCPNEGDQSKALLLNALLKGKTLLKRDASMKSNIPLKAHPFTSTFNLNHFKSIWMRQMKQEMII